MIRGTSEKFSLIRPDEKWTSGRHRESRARIAYRITSRSIVSFRIVSYRSVSYSIVSRGAVTRASALLFHGKRKRGEDGAEPRRQSATGNLKSCANTQATGELNGSQGDAPVEGAS